MSVSRRVFVFGAPAVLAGCSSLPSEAPTASYIDPQYAQMYAAIDSEPYPVPAVDLNRVKPQFWRQEVDYQTYEQPGTIVVDTGQRFAYLIMENGRALRYGVGVGKTEALQFKGEANIGRKAEWPRWTPTADMIAREPDRYGPYADGMPGGPTNPLGPRAMYLYADNRDTLFRLHGTVEPWTIGTMVSSGCIRFMNQDIIDLYGRVPVGTRVAVLQQEGGAYG
jgi:lipoprotein-anchoring transpeptidase ErfK/SrfK